MVPPPLPGGEPTRLQAMTYGNKVFLLILQCAFLVLCSLAVYMLIYSRMRSNTKVTNEITRDWGKAVYFDGIKATRDVRQHTSFSPEALDCDVTVKAQTLHRGIYEAEVFNADVAVSATFSKRELQRQAGNMVEFYLGMPDRRIEKLGTVSINGKAHNWQLKADTLMVAADIASMPEKIVVETTFATRGSGGFYVARTDGSNRININGKAANPSFGGSTLPTGRSIGRMNRFEAMWENQSRNEYPTVQGDTDYDDEYVVVEEVADDGYSAAGTGDYVGSDFLVGNDRYMKVERSLKYAFIIILLTYIAVLCVEILRKKRIPLLNYFLIGVALILFYSLLLSFCELMSFWVAYLIASAMTVGLISGYMGMIMRSKATGWQIAALLAIYYGACYAMLASTYALLIGSLLLFAAIGLLMYSTLKFRT